MNWTSLRKTGWSSWLQENIDYFKENSKVDIENNARWEAILLGYASASWTEATFPFLDANPRTTGLSLLDAIRKAGTITQPKIDHIWRVPLEFKITEWRPFAALVAEMWVVATETDKGATHTY